MTRRTRPLPWIGLAGVGLLLVVAFSPLSNALFRWSAAASDVQPADAIVVLAAAMDPDGTLSCESLVRTVRAVALYRMGRAPIIVFSGPTHEEGPSEARVRADLAFGLGVPGSDPGRDLGAHDARGGGANRRHTARSKRPPHSAGDRFAAHAARARPLLAWRPPGLPGQRRRPIRRGHVAGRAAVILRDLLGEWLALGYYRVAGYL